MLSAMRDVCRLIWWALVGLFRSRSALEAENLVLRQQLNVLRRTGPKRPAFSWTDRLIFVGLGPVRRCSSGAGDYQTGHRDPLAPYGIQSLLALEVEVARRTATVPREVRQL